MKKIIFLICFIWSLLNGASFIWNHMHVKEDKETFVLEIIARCFVDQTVLDRTRNADHGEVYASVTDKTRPNPSLEDPLRDIEVNGNL